MHCHRDIIGITVIVITIRTGTRPNLNGTSLIAINHIIICGSHRESAASIPVGIGNGGCGRRNATCAAGRERGNGNICTARGLRIQCDGKIAGTIGFTDSQRGWINRDARRVIVHRRYTERFIR